MSAVANRASGVEMALLRRYLVVVRLAVSVVVMSGHSSKLPPPPTVTRIQCVSVLLGRSKTTSQQYDTVWLFGTASCLTKNIVFVPFFIQVTTL